ncbi:MAG: DUF3137 domain-containing protein [Dehalobacterium sp.]|jgi:hypothetical protein
MGWIYLVSKRKQENKQKKLDEKAALVREVLNEVFADCVYNPQGSIKGEIVRDSGLIDEWDLHCDSFDTNKWFHFTGNDYFSGRYKGCEIECCDVDITKHWKVTDEDEDGHETEREECETSFKGLWMICKMDKSLPVALRIREKKDTPLLFRKIAGQRIAAKSDVETENLAFNEQFQILTTDPHSAFYVLTPHFMENILAADRQAYGRTMLCFSDDRVHIAIHNRRDSFQFKLKKRPEASDIDAIKLQLREELQYLNGILDELLHNDRLFGNRQ